MAQVRCSQCGSYKVTSTYKQMATNFGCLIAIPVMAWPFVGFLAGGNIVIGIAWAVFWIIIAFIGQAFINPYKNHYSCNNCGYVWRE
jgi:hypothetical protein